MKEKRRDKRECKVSLAKVSFLKKSLVTAILVISVLTMFTAVASATDYYVRTGGADEASREGLVNDDAHAWKTISYAIGRAEVTAGDTIHVAAGEYSENVNVNKRLTLQGEGADVVTVTNSTANHHVFEVTMDYVNISGFNVTGATGVWKAGIYLSSNVDHCNISDNYASNNYNGIYLYSSSNNNLSGNIAYNNSNLGIHLDSSSSNNLSGNNAYNNSRHGVKLDYSSNNNLSGNNAYDNSDEGIRLDYSSNNNNLTSNTANSNDDCGIWVHSSSSNTLNNNTANSNTRYGIWLAGACDNEITCNWVAHNEQRGFNLDCQITGNNISYNNIMHNGELQLDGSYHWNFYNGQNNPVEAKHNYWVAADNATIDASIYEGTGEVTFYPFLEGASPCAPIPELPTIILFSIGLLVLAGYLKIKRKD